MQTQCCNQNCNQGRTCTALETRCEGKEVFVVDSRRIEKGSACMLLDVWRKANGRMTVWDARKKLAPGPLVSIAKGLLYCLIYTAVLFVIFPPLFVLGVIIGVLHLLCVFGAALEFEVILPKEKSHCVLEVIQ